eukprot:765420-Hanusia_phi.AAC.2
MFSYITLVVQHPYGEPPSADMAMISDTGSTGKAAYVGYIGPLPYAGTLSRTAASSSPVVAPATSSASSFSPCSAFAFVALAMASMLYSRLH